MEAGEVEWRKRAVGIASHHSDKIANSKHSVKFNEKAKPGTYVNKPFDSKLKTCQFLRYIFNNKIIHLFSLIPGTFVARDNVANFILWARSIGIDAAVVFESDDLIGRKNEKNVLYWY